LATFIYNEENHTSKYHLTANHALGYVQLRQ